MPRVGVRTPIALAFALGAGGTLLLSRVHAGGSYLGTVLPGMVIAGVGIGIAMVSIAVALLSGARERNAGMLSGLNNTGHELGGALGLAALTTIAARATDATAVPSHAAIAAGLGHAFVAAAGVAGAGLLLALLVLPAARSFLPRLGDAPQPVSLH